MKQGSFQLCWSSATMRWSLSSSVLLILLLALFVQRCSQVPSVFVGDHEVHFVHPNPSNSTNSSDGSEKFLIQIVSTNQSTVTVKKNVTDEAEEYNYEDYEDEEDLIKDDERRFNVTLPDGQLVNVFAGARSVTLYFPKSQSTGDFTQTIHETPMPSADFDYDPEFFEDPDEDDEETETEGISGRAFGADKCLIIEGRDPFVGTLSRNYRPSGKSDRERDHWDNFGDVLADIISKLRKIEDDIKKRPKEQQSPFPRPVYERPTARERPEFGPQPHNDPDIPILDHSYDYNVDEDDHKSRPVGYGVDLPKRPYGYGYSPLTYATTGYSVLPSIELTYQTATVTAINGSVATTPKETVVSLPATYASTNTTQAGDGIATTTPSGHFNATTSELGNLTTDGRATSVSESTIASGATDTGNVTATGRSATELGNATTVEVGSATYTGGTTVEVGNAASTGGTTVEVGSAMYTGGTTVEVGSATYTGGTTVEVGNAASTGGTTVEAGSAASTGGTTVEAGSAASTGGTTVEVGSAASTGETTVEVGSAASTGGTTVEVGSAASTGGTTVEAGSAASTAGAIEEAGSAASTAGAIEEAGSAASTAGAIEEAGSAASTAGTIEETENTTISAEGVTVKPQNATVSLTTVTPYNRTSIMVPVQPASGTSESPALQPDSISTSTSIALDNITTTTDQLDLSITTTQYATSTVTEVPLISVSTTSPLVTFSSASENVILPDFTRGVIDSEALDVRIAFSAKPPLVTTQSTPDPRPVKALGRAADENHDSSSVSNASSVGSTLLFTESVPLPTAFTNETTDLISASYLEYNETITNASSLIDSLVDGDWLSSRAANITEQLEPTLVTWNTTFPSQNDSYFAPSITSLYNISEMVHNFTKPSLEFSLTTRYYADDILRDDSSWNISTTDLPENLTSLASLSDDVEQYILLPDLDVELILNETLNRTVLHHNESLAVYPLSNFTYLARLSDIAEDYYSNVSSNHSSSISRGNITINDTVYESAYGAAKLHADFNTTVPFNLSIFLNQENKTSFGRSADDLEHYSSRLVSVLGQNGTGNYTMEPHHNLSLGTHLLNISTEIPMFADAVKNYSLDVSSRHAVNISYEVQQGHLGVIPEVFNITLFNETLHNTSTETGQWSLAYNSTTTGHPLPEVTSTPYNETSSPHPYLQRLYLAVSPVQNTTASVHLSQSSMDITNASLSTLTADDEASDRSALVVPSQACGFAYGAKRRSWNETIALLQHLVDSKAIFSDKAINLFLRIDLEGLLSLELASYTTMPNDDQNTTANTTDPIQNIGYNSIPSDYQYDEQESLFTTITVDLNQSTPMEISNTTLKYPHERARYGGFPNKSPKMDLITTEQPSSSSVPENVTEQTSTTTHMFTTKSISQQITTSVSEPVHMKNESHIPTILRNLSSDLRLQDPSSSKELHVPKRHTEELLHEFDDAIVACNSTQDCRATANERCVDGHCGCGKGFSRESSYGVCMPNSRSMAVARVAPVMGDSKNAKSLQVSDGPCSVHEMNHCSVNAVCYPDDHNPVVPYVCVCREGFNDESPSILYPGEVCIGVCHDEACSGRGLCTIDQDGNLTCICDTWFMGQHCEMDSLAILFGVLGGFGIVITICLGTFCIYNRLVNTRRWASLV